MHPDPSEELPDKISNSPEFIKRLTESRIASKESLAQIDLLTIHPPYAEGIKKTSRN